MQPCGVVFMVSLTRSVIQETSLHDQVCLRSLTADEDLHWPSSWTRKTHPKCIIIPWVQIPRKLLEEASSAASALPLRWTPWTVTHTHKKSLLRPFLHGVWPQQWEKQLRQASITNRWRRRYCRKRRPFHCSLFFFKKFCLYLLKTNADEVRSHLKIFFF